MDGERWCWTNGQCRAVDRDGNHRVVRATIESVSRNRLCGLGTAGTLCGRYWRICDTVAIYGSLLYYWHYLGLISLPKERNLTYVHSIETHSNLYIRDPADHNNHNVNRDRNRDGC